jgi:hypothetical protein
VNVRPTEYLQPGMKLVNAKLPDLSVRSDAFFSKITLLAGETFQGSYELNFKLNFKLNRRW